MDPYQTYIHTLCNDVEYHDFTKDGETWPASARECGVLLQDAFDLPEWVWIGPYPYVDVRVEPLLEALHRSVVGKEPPYSARSDHDRRLREIFNSTMSDCVSLRNRLHCERLDGYVDSKECLLAIMMRNAMCHARPGLRIHEGVPVALPLRASGELSPLFRYMPRRIEATLLVCIEEEMTTTRTPADLVTTNISGSAAHHSGVRSRTNNLSHKTGTGESSNGDYDESLLEDSPEPSTSANGSPRSPQPSPLFVKAPGRTVSEWLACADEKPEDDEDEDDDEDMEDQRCLAELDVHALDYWSTKLLPTRAALPVLCMAEVSRLPVVITSLLYQRRRWGVDEPVVGVAFSEYGSTVTVYLGWTDSETECGNILPRAHLGRLDHLDGIDMADPASALSVSQFLLDLEGHISRVREVADRTKASVKEEIKHGVIASWRVDSGMMAADGTVASDDGDYERINIWLGGLQYKSGHSYYSSDTMSETVSSDAVSDTVQLNPSRRQNPVRGGRPKDDAYDDAFTSGSEGKDREEKKKPAGKASQGKQASSTTSGRTARFPPSERGRPGRYRRLPSTHRDDAKVSVMLKLLCARKKEDAGENIAWWLFDRNTITESLLIDKNFQDWFYKETANFIWPKEWEHVDKMPSVSEPVQECLEDLQELYTLRLQQHEEKPKQFPKVRLVDDVVTKYLMGSLSAILGACEHAREMANANEHIDEVNWRHDFDRLLFDFVNDIVLRRAMVTDGGVDGIAVRGDSGSKKLLNSRSERMIQLPRNYFADIVPPVSTERNLRTRLREFTKSIEELPEEKLEEWANDQAHLDWLEKSEINDHVLITRRAGDWRRTCSADAFKERLTVAPVQGRCDALSTIRVKIPFRHKELGFFRFATLHPPKESYTERTKRIAEEMVQSAEPSVQSPESNHSGIDGLKSEEPKPQDPDGSDAEDPEPEVSEIEDLESDVGSEDHSSTAKYHTKPKPISDDPTAAHTKQSASRRRPAYVEGDIFASAKCESEELEMLRIINASKAKADESRLAESLKGLSLKDGEARDPPPAEAIPPAPEGPESMLELPLFVFEYKRYDTDGTILKGENQQRLYCTSAARFLEAVGITGHPVFSVLSDGPKALLSAAWIKGTNGAKSESEMEPGPEQDKARRVHIYERHGQAFDISSPIGAWHYATVLCRIALKFGPRLAEEFEKVKDNLVERLKTNDPSVHWALRSQVDHKKKDENAN